MISDMEFFILALFCAVPLLMVYKVGKKVGYKRAKKDRRDWILNILIAREEERLRAEEEKQHQEHQEYIKNNPEPEAFGFEKSEEINND